MLSRAGTLELAVVLLVLASVAIVTSLA